MASAPPAPRPAPRVSVVMPVRNEAPFLARSLGAVLAQDLPPGELEILVIDGMSDDGTADLARRIGGDRVRVIANPERTAAHAMNRGIAAARGGVIVRVDGHAEIGPSHVSRALAVLAETGAEAVGGPLRTVGEGPVGRALALALSSRIGVGASRFRVEPAHAGEVDTVPFPAYTRGAFRRAGMFDTALVRNQDDEFHLRLAAAGGRILLDPGLVSTYHARSSLAAAWRQFAGYGFWKVAVRRKHGRLATWRAYAPPLFVLALVASVVMAAVLASPWVLLVVAAPYALVLAAWTLVVGLRRDAFGALLAPVAFATVHLAYGCGYLAGLLAAPRPAPWRAAGGTA